MVAPFWQKYKKKAVPKGSGSHGFGKRKNAPAGANKKRTDP